jgi:surface antigen
MLVMRDKATALFFGLLLGFAPSVQARPALAIDDPAGGAAPPAANFLQCVPYARNLSGIRLYGDAHTWWQQAAGRYARGRVPKVGAVMAIEPHGNSTLGHVATVSRVIDTRTILINHANWSNPGGIERNVTAVDVSPANDWSEVRVWYAPARNLGASHWPVSGFIYNAAPGVKWASSPSRPATSPVRSKGAKAARIDKRRDPIGAIIAGSY